MAEKDLTLCYAFLVSNGRNQRMMSPDMRAKLRNLLVAHEGLRKFPYSDTLGKITIGIGYNLTDRGMTDAWINEQYEKDVLYFYNQLMEDFYWYKNLDEARQMVLIDMCFMGYQHFLQFQKMFEAMAKCDYKTAALEMLNSEWADQTKSRATDLATIMVNGVIE